MEVLAMDVVNPSCAGLDVHKRTVVACRIASGPDGQPLKELRSFGTTTRELLALAAWLAEAGVGVVAMEATGSFWKPVYNVLEGSFELLVANARHLKAVPGRKTDMRDAEWIADLLRHGLLRASFVPDRPERELRELTRYRTSLIRERAAELNRIAKVLEGLIAGESDPATLADLARGRLRDKREALEAALEGRVGAHQRFLLGAQLRHLAEVDALIAEVSAEIEARLRPFADALERLTTIPGVGRRTAETVLAEVGPEMSRFPSASHLASWAGMCPGNYESAGRSRSGRTRKGSPWLRGALVESAKSAARPTSAPSSTASPPAVAPSVPRWRWAIRC
jgi:transposase